MRVCSFFHFITILFFPLLLIFFSSKNYCKIWKWHAHSKEKKRQSILCVTAVGGRSATTIDGPSAAVAFDIYEYEPPFLSTHFPAFRAQSEQECITFQTVHKNKIRSPLRDLIDSEKSIKNDIRNIKPKNEDRIQVTW